jgi:hypothetical protein
MAAIIHAAVQLNQEGANEFVRGNLTLALDSFRHALQTMIRFEPQADIQDTNDVTRVNSSGLAAMGITHVPMRSGSHANQMGEPFTYLKPFVFNSTLIPQDQDGIAVFSAVVVFNMAIVFHQKSLLESDPFVTKALHLYESSVDLFSKISSRYDLSGTIALALNNKASLHFAGGDYESSDLELERLQSVMARAEYSMSTEAILQGSDFQGILMNLLMLRPPRIAQAA